MDPDLFLADLEAKPDALRALADFLDTENPWAALPQPVSRVLMLGMGSSGYATLPVARRMRAAGFNAIAEYASVACSYPPTPDTLVVAVSANGVSREPIAAVADYPSYVALTNVPDSPLGKGADLLVPMRAGVEKGGLASRTYLHSIVLLDALAAHLTGIQRDQPGLCRKAADAIADLLDRRDAWLPRVIELLDSPDGFFAIAPAERVCSAGQSALIVREAVARRADACETGDWAHVDLYVTKTLDYRALFFPGSDWDEAALRWLRERRSTVVAVGADIGEAAFTLRYPYDDDPDVRLLTEVLVAELVATTWWSNSR